MKQLIKKICKPMQLKPILLNPIIVSKKLIFLEFEPIKLLKPKK